MPQGPVRDTVRARRLADLDTPYVILKLLTVDEIGFASTGHYVRLQHHVNHLNNVRELRIGHRLKLSVQNVGKGFGFLRISGSESTWGDQRVGGVVTLINRFVILHSEWSS